MQLCHSAVILEPNMVLKWKFRVIWQKSLRTYESIILEISLSYPKFLILKLADLKPWKIFKIFDAESAVRLSPYKDDKLKRLEFNRFKAYCVQVLLHYGNCITVFATINALQNITLKQC